LKKRDLDADDIAAALTGLSVALVASLMEPGNQTGDEVLQQLANETDNLANVMPNTNGGIILKKVVAMLLHSKTRR